MLPTWMLKLVLLDKKGTPAPSGFNTGCQPLIIRGAPDFVFVACNTVAQFGYNKAGDNKGALCWCV